jgi:hypothetical protein
MKVFDTFTFFNELDLLEIRLNILDEHVDHFVITESIETFSGKEKPLYFEFNKERFGKWKDKIIHNIVPKKDCNNAFERAFFQKESIKNVLALKAKDEDIVYFGDLDEIWKPQRVEDKVLNLKQLNYCYYLNQRSSEEWVGTIVGKWKEIKKDTLSYWRANHTYEVDNGGWHFTNMGGVDQIQKKLEAYDHQENFTKENISQIEERIKYGEDYVGREYDWKGRPFTFRIDETNLPSYVIINKQKYATYFK